MQHVTNTLFNQNQETSGGLKEGDIYRAKVLERKEGNQAVVHMKGMKRDVRFEGSLPKKDNTLVQVTGKKEELAQVRAIEKNRANSNETNKVDIASLLKKAGGKEPSENLMKAARSLQNKGIPLTKESVHAMKSFMKSSEGTDRQKLNTIQAAAAKQVDITENNLKNIHESLHGKGASEFLNNHRSRSDVDTRMDRNINEVVKKAIRHVTSSHEGLQGSLKEIQRRKGNDFDDVQREIRSRILEHPQVTREQKTTVERALKEAEHLQHTGKQRLYESITRGDSRASNDLLQKLAGMASGSGSREATRKQVQALLSAHGYSKENVQAVLKLIHQLEQLKEAGNQRIIDALKLVESYSSSQKKAIQQDESLELLKKSVNQQPDLEKVLKQIKKEDFAGVPSDIRRTAFEQIDQSSALFEQGKEMAARQFIHEALDMMTGALQKSAAIQQEQASSSVYALNEKIHTTTPFETKQLLETKVMEKLAHVTDEFTQIKKDTVKQLEQAVKLMQQDKQSMPQAKQILEAAIKQLDRTILRSDAMLFTDMKAERKLLEASGQLAEARSLLAKGKLSASLQIIKDVQGTLDKLPFSPTEQKVKHFITKDEGLFSNKQVESAVRHISEQGRQVMQDPSARQTFELIRMLGLNRESEIGQMLASKEQAGQSSSHQQNLKEVILQLLKNEDPGSKSHQQASSALANLSGQQLLSKADHGSTVQHLLFNLPIPLKEENEQLKVYVKSRQEGEQIDWENCNLYFFINTPSLGDTGIMIQSQERQLSVTLKNDQHDFAETMKPLVEKTTAAITELGYQLNDIRYQPFHNENGMEEKEEVEWLPFYTEKGFDYKI